MVDADVYEWAAQHRWYRKPDGYVVRNIPKEGGGQQTLSLHRAVMGLKPGDSQHVDHISHDLLDNCRTNLRLCSHAENHQNRRADRGASSRYRGVSWNREKQKWHAYGALDGHLHHLGFYTDEQEAADAAAAWRELHLPFTTN